LTSDSRVLDAGLNGLVTAEGTRLDLGLEAAVAQLTGPRARPAARRILILLTDGKPDGGTDAQLAAAVQPTRAAAITAYPLGLGRDVDAALLRQVSGAPSRYYPAPSKDDLARIYRRIAEGLPCG